MPALEIADLAITYGGSDGSVAAVRGVDLTVEAGASLGIAGESGCGKSTLALSVLRLLPGSTTVTGAVRLDGADVFGLRWGELRAVRWAGASIIFQGALHSLNPVRPIGDQVAEPLLLHRIGERTTHAQRHQALEQAGLLLEQVGLPAWRVASYPHELSGGQRQRVMIAMALACEPDLIVADEPTTALDVVIQAGILAVLRDLVAERGVALVVISHDLAVLSATCAEVAVMYAGRIVERGPGADLFTGAEHPYTQGLAAAFPTVGDPASRYAPHGLAGDPPDLADPPPGCAFAARCPRSTDRCRDEDPELAAVGADRYVACWHPGPDPAEPTVWTVEPGTPGPDVHTPAPPAGTELRADDLHVDFGARGRVARAVDGVNLTLRAGEIVALVGESGSGKTTVGRSLLGLVRPTAGTFTRDGESLGRSTAALRRHRRTVQLVLQDPTGALNPRQNVFDAVAEGLRVHKVGDVRRRVLEALERVGLRPADRFANRYPHELSGGQRQRVVIAGALVLDPEVIIADEPVASLDASVRGEILALLLRLRDELGLGALVVTHDLGVAWNIADRIAVMYLGRIVESGPVEEVLTRPRHPYTRALLDALPHRSLEGHDPRPLPGEMPDPTAIPAGCRFHPRCPALAGGAADAVADRCRGVPLEVLPATLDHVAACHLADHLIG